MAKGETTTQYRVESYQFLGSGGYKQIDRQAFHSESSNENVADFDIVIDPLAEPLGYPAAGCIMLVGYAYIQHPQAVFRIRNFPGLKSESGLTETGVTFYRLLGYLFVLMGGFVLLLTLVGGPSSL